MLAYSDRFLLCFLILDCELLFSRGLIGRILWGLVWKYIFLRIVIFATLRCTQVYQQSCTGFCYIFSFRVFSQRKQSKLKFQNFIKARMWFKYQCMLSYPKSRLVNANFGSSPFVCQQFISSFPCYILLQVASFLGQPFQGYHVCLYFEFYSSIAIMAWAFWFMKPENYFRRIKYSAPIYHCESI